MTPSTSLLLPAYRGCLSARRFRAGNSADREIRRALPLASPEVVAGRNGSRRASRRRCPSTSGRRSAIACASFAANTGAKAEGWHRRLPHPPSHSGLMGEPSRSEGGRSGCGMSSIIGPGYKGAASLSDWRWRRRRRICRRREAGRRRGCDDAPARRRGRRAFAVCAAVPEGGGTDHRSDRQHPALSRRSSRLGAGGRGGPVVGPSAAADDRRLCRRGSRYPSSDRQQPLLRRPAPGSARPRRRLSEIASAEISRLFRTGAGAQSGRPGSSGRCGADLSGSVALSTGGGYALRLSARHGAARAETTRGSLALHDRVAALPRIAAYLASDRRIPFNEHGIFRHYPELDSAA